jgi:A/G-specific adenine glycosylase
MELGATVCVPREPRCLLCPLRGSCEARARGLERELPRIGAKKPPREVSRAALVARDARGAVLLARRKPDGLFGGMWEPPSIDASADDDASALAPRFAATLGSLRVTALEHIGSITHVLTHRKMHVDILSARVSDPQSRALSPIGSHEYDALDFVTDIKSRGITTLAKKILARARE